MQPPLVCHLDMNSYFASVEQQAHPSWRGKPVAVCAYVHANGCIIAPSIEAKQRGIRTGMRVHDAQRIAPDTIFVECDPTKYRSVTSRLFSLMEVYSDRIERYSIDEAFFHLTGWCRDTAEAAFLCSHIKWRIQHEIGSWLRCSIGIAPTRFFAKLASDLKKPDGLTILELSTIDQTLAHLPLEAACGIGPRMRHRLECVGLRTLLDLKQYPLTHLTILFGQYGVAMWNNVNGVESDGWGFKNAVPKSIGHSYCVPKTISGYEQTSAVLHKLTERACRRLRTNHLFAQSVHVVVDYRSIPEGSATRQKNAMHHVRLSEPTDITPLLFKHALHLFRAQWTDQPLRYIAITLSDLQSTSGQQSWCPDHSQKRAHSITHAMDRIRDRYGETSMMYGRIFNARHHDIAPDRIGFRSLSSVTTTQI